MNTSQIISFAALSIPAVITIALAQFMALVGSPHRAADMQMARADAPRPGDTGAQATYLPALFVEEERAARIEPMPPQF